MIFKMGDSILLKDRSGIIQYTQKHSKLCWIYFFDNEKVERHKFNSINLAPAKDRLVNLLYPKKILYDAEIVKVIKFVKFEIRYEILDLHNNNVTHFIARRAYNNNGDYIGGPENARFLCGKYGINPEVIDSESKVCSIGFSEKRNKWYGWSHRAICGFTIGSKVKFGDCAYRSKDKKEFVKELKRSLSGKKNLIIREGVDTSCSYSLKNKRGLIISYDNNNSNVFYWECYPEKWGRGEWVAQTMEDAKQMAMDFARDVA